MPLDFGDPPRACDMPYCLFMDESNSGGRATSRSRAPLLTQVLVQGSFLLLTYQCTSDLYYPLLFSCTSECSSGHLCPFCCTSEFECISAHTFPTFVLLIPSRIKRRRPNFLDALSQKCARAPCFSAARGAGSARWMTPQPRDFVHMCDVIHVSLHLRLSIPH